MAAVLLAAGGCAATDLMAARDLDSSMAGKTIYISTPGGIETVTLASVEDGVLYTEDGRSFPIAEIDGVAGRELDKGTVVLAAGGAAGIYIVVGVLVAIASAFAL